MWIKKSGYSTFLLENENELDSPGSEIQLVRFEEGKYAHYHKKKTEYFYFLKGKGKAIINGEEIIIKQGTSILVKPNTIHTFISDPTEPLEAIQMKTNNVVEDTYSDK
jgi:quercetin dioxygenase-like cupin family protein